jgi:Tol biopolymer transport system component
VQAVGSESRLRLTDSEEQESLPVWSPDGGRIAFVRQSDRGCEIAVVSAVGGPASRLVRCGAGGVAGLDWSPAKDEILFTHREEPHAPARAVTFSLTDTSARPFLEREGALGSVEEIAFSPDGKSVAFTLGLALGVEDAYVHSLERGTTTRVTHDHLKIHGLDWTPDGRALVLSSNRGGEFSLWRFPLDGSEPVLIPGAAGGADEPRVSSTGRLVYESWRVSASIWSLPLASGGPPRLLLPTTRMEWDAERSPRGGRLTFVSDRSGAAEVWTAEEDGSDPVRLTSFGGAYTHTPRLSPDGGTIAFATPLSGNFDLFLVDAEASSPRRATEHPAEDFAPAWSPDGRAIYFGSTRSGEWQIWRLELDGGSEQQVTANGGRVAQVSPDGRFLYYGKPAEPGLWRLELLGGATTEERVLDELEPVDWNNWQLLERAIYYVRRPVPDEPEIVRLDFATGERELVVRVPDLLYKSGIWVAPDESELLYSRVGTAEADIMLLEP